MKTTNMNINITSKFNTLLTVLISKGLVLLSVCKLACNKIRRLTLKEPNVLYAQL